MNQFKHGNCWEFVKELEDNSIDCIATDPPYNSTANEWEYELNLELFWQEFFRVLKFNGSIVMTTAQPFTTKVISSNMDCYKYEWIWQKNTKADFIHAKNRPIRLHENILVFSKAPMGHVSLLGEKRMRYNPQGLKKEQRKYKAGYGTKNIGNRPSDADGVCEYSNYPTTILKFEQGNSNSLHPTQKPVPLFEYLIRTYTNEGDTVLDPFGGSGTTAVACIRTKRKFITYEQDSTYFETMKKRIELEQSKITLF